MAGLLASGVLLVGGCVTLPGSPAARGLYIDLRSAVELSQDSGWVADQEELLVSAKDALRSVCQVEPALRAQLDAWLGEQIARAGGSAERVYREHGGDLAAAAQVLVLERTRTLLRYANARAAADCPFWLAPRKDFRGEQGAAGRFVWLAETQAFGALVVRSGDPGPGFGASVRVLAGHGLGPRFTLAVGGELGVASAVLDRAQGARRLQTSLTSALPILLRLTRFSRVFDFELAPVLRVVPAPVSFPPGVRIAVGAGTALRTFPGIHYGVLWLGYEYHPPTSGEAADHSVLLGTRIGLN